MGVAVFVRIISILAWVVALGSIVLAVSTFVRTGKARFGVGMVVTGLIVAIGLTAVSAGLVFVEPQERGVVISALQPGGYRPAALEPGLRWIIPFLENVIYYPVSKQTYTMSATATEGQLSGDDSVKARTSDGQEIFIDASIIYSIDPAQVTTVHIEWQNRYTDELIRPQSRGIIRDVAAQYQVEEIYSTKRQEFQEKITTNIREALNANGIQLDSFLLRNVTFTPDYAAAIEQKQIAEQEVQRAAFVVQQREQEAAQLRAQAQGLADSQVIQAQGEADSNLIKAKAQAQALEEIGQSLRSNPDLLQYTYIQQLSDNVQIMLVPSNSPYLFNLPNLDSNSSSFVLPTPNNSSANAGGDANGDGN